MKTINWSDDISVNNEVIDNQHKRLFELTNNLIRNKNSKTTDRIIGESLNELIHYTQTHFKDEEQILEERKYPKLDEHKKIHNSFLKEVILFTKDVMEAKTTVTEKLIKYLIDWLLNHTSIDDQDYKNYL